MTQSAIVQRAPIRRHVPPTASNTDRWWEDRTTFQRVYDVLVGTREFLSAAEFAERADCAENEARRALEQLTEMGLAVRRGSRPARSRRTDSYLTWRRIESLTGGSILDELRYRLDALIAEDDAFQEANGVPVPDAEVNDDLRVDDHEALNERWDDLTEWRTVRRDISLLRPAVQRAD